MVFILSICDDTIMHMKAVLLLWIFYGFLFCLVFAMPLWASVYMCLVVTCWERVDLLDLALVYGVKLLVCHFPIGILGQVWYLIVSISDLCTLTYFVMISWAIYELLPIGFQNVDVFFSPQPLISKR